jgi:hypothetical protein
MYVQLYKAGVLVSYVHSGSLIREVTLNTGEARLQREIPHLFNFKFKATQIVPLDEGVFLVID